MIFWYKYLQDLGSHHFEQKVPDPFSPVSHLNALEGDLELERVEEGAGIVQHYHIAHMYFGHTLSLKEGKQFLQ